MDPVPEPDSQWTLSADIKRFESISYAEFLAFMKTDKPLELQPKEEVPPRTGELLLQPIIPTVDDDPTIRNEGPLLCLPDDETEGNIGVNTHTFLSKMMPGVEHVSLPKKPRLKRSQAVCYRRWPGWIFHTWMYFRYCWRYLFPE